jgi:hypothetical protein
MRPGPKASSSVGIAFIRAIASAPDALAAATPMLATAFR